MQKWNISKIFPNFFCVYTKFKKALVILHKITPAFFVKIIMALHFNKNKK